ncbi:MAG TPA: GNAT family N-acetyltransferase [Pseudomonadales bacterium]
MKLRPLDADDGDLLAALYGDADVMRYSRIGVLSRAAALERLAEWVGSTRDRYWVVRDDEGADVGCIFLRNVDPAHRSAELGYLLASGAWGRGLASAAVAAVLDVAFAELQLCRVEAYVDADNGASLRVLEKNGFEREGLRRADTWRGDRAADTVLLSRLNEPLLRSLRG